MTFLAGKYTPGSGGLIGLKSIWPILLWLMILVVLWKLGLYFEGKK